MTSVIDVPLKLRVLNGRPASRTFREMEERDHRNRMISAAPTILSGPQMEDIPVAALVLKACG